MNMLSNRKLPQLEVSARSRLAPSRQRSGNTRVLVKTKAELRPATEAGEIITGESEPGYVIKNYFDALKDITL